MSAFICVMCQIIFVFINFPRMISVDLESPVSLFPVNTFLTLLEMDFWEMDITRCENEGAFETLVPGNLFTS